MRITFSVVLFYVWFGASAALVDTVGLTEALGVSGSTTAGDKFSESVESLSNVNVGISVVDSLVNVYTAVTTAAEGFVLALTAGPRLLINLGIPPEFVFFLHAPIVLLAGRFLIYMFSGRDA